MTLALFDLDNTLLAGDSDYLWGCHLAAHGVVDREHYQLRNRRYYEDYQNGRLDIMEFLGFALEPLTRVDPGVLMSWREQFVHSTIEPLIAKGSRQLLDWHRARGDTLMIITATNSFVTRPIADALGVEHLLATEPELENGRYTGRVAGTPCFREGKVLRLRRWLEDRSESLSGSWFYSDSHNDLPLLEKVDHPVAVDPDPSLAETAERRLWPVMSLRRPFHAESPPHRDPG